MCFLKTRIEASSPEIICLCSLILDLASDTASFHFRQEASKISLDISLSMMSNAPMVESEYKAALEKARKDIAECEAERDSLETRLVALRATETALARMCGEEAQGFDADAAARGFTDACRAVLRGSTKALTPTEVRNQLVEAGLDASKYTNVMAVIHAILKRLVKAGQADESTAPSGGTAYSWKRDARRRFTFEPGKFGAAGVKDALAKVK
jgi:hypothetical protein